MSRFQIDLNDNQQSSIKSMMEDLHITKKKDLFNNALTLLEWAIEELKKGNSIASVNEEKKKYANLTMPALSGLRKKNSD